MLCSGVLVHQALDDFLGIVELVETVPEQSRLLEVLDVRLSALQFVKLHSQRVEDTAHARVVCQHHTADFVLSGDIRTFLGESHLNGCGAPRDEVRQLSLSDSLKRFMHLRRVNVALNNVQDRDVAAFLDACVDENILRVQQSPHDIQHSRLSD